MSWAEALIFLSSASPNTLENWDLFVDFLKAFVHIRKFRTLLADLPGMQLDMPKLITALHRRDGKIVFKTWRHFLMHRQILTIS
jgi:hypothetical protein